MRSYPAILLSAWLAAATSGEAERACSAFDADGCAQHAQARDEASLLQARRVSSSVHVPGDAAALAGKSIYFLLVDRFARTDGSTEACGNKEDNNDWCGGSLRGVTQQLDYIQGMGFDCIWITPVVKQYSGKTPSGTGAMGYWAEDLYKIDEHYGTPQDLHDLVDGLHSRGMCIVLDFVANHMGPVHSEADVYSKRPFNKLGHYHQLFRGDMSFNDYVSKTSNWPPPAQAMWSQSGAQCTKGKSCNCYKCVEELNLLGLPSSVGTCNGKMVFNEASPCPKNSLSAYCMPGDYKCKGYNETITQQGWFYDLGDLNQTDPFVRTELKKWIRWMVSTYNLDALRLDTAPFMSFDFLSELQAAARVPIIGEVTAQNLTFHAQFEANPPPMGRPVLDGVLNFPLYFAAVAGFCGTWQPLGQFNLTYLGHRMLQQRDSGLYRNLNTLGNFPDNHDGDRITTACKGDTSRVANAVAWSMLAQGAPIIYYGTERLLTWSRESMWTFGYIQDAKMYQMIKKLNELRKGENLALAGFDVKFTLDRRTLVFTRADDKVWVYTNNIQDTDQVVLYCGRKALPGPAKSGFQWVDMLSGEAAVISKVGADEEPCLVAGDSQPKVLVQRAKASSYATYRAATN